MHGQLIIGGKLVQGSGIALVSENPATGAVLWSGAAATPPDVDRAVMAARTAFDDWGLLPFADRLAHVEAFTAYLGDHKDTLAALISAETGKALWDAAGEAGAMIGKGAISVKAYHDRTPTTVADTGAMRTRLTHRPHGVMAVFGPYNFPGHLPNGHIIPALLAGNTVVFKPSELTPAVGEWMVDAWHRAGLPDGVVNMVQGGRDVGEALVANPDINGVLFTGSVPTGRAIARALVDRPEVIQALELGGNNPLIVHEVADQRAAAVMTVNSAFITSGQRCTCARRLIVPAGADGDAFLKTLVQATEALRIAPGDSDPQPFMGPLISAAAADHMLAAQSALIDAGGKALLPGAGLAHGPAFVSPAIIDVTGVADRPDEEVFGPLLQVIRVAGLEAALVEANNTRFGLAFGLISDSRAAYDYIYPRARAGIVNWNQQTTGASSAAPFGGTGLSGNYRPSAYYAADYVAYAVASIEHPDDRVAVASLPTGLDF